MSLTPIINPQRCTKFIKTGINISSHSSSLQIQKKLRRSYCIQPPKGESNLDKGETEKLKRKLEETPPSEDWSLLNMFTRKDEIHKLLKEVHWISRKNSENILRIVLGMLIAAAILLLIFWDQIQTFLGRQTATVATIGLEDEKVQVKMEEFSKALVKQLLSHYANDEGTKKVTVDFVKSIIEDKTTIQSVVELVNKVVSHDSFTEEASKMSKSVVREILNDPQITDETIKFFSRTFSMKITQEILSKLFINVLNSPIVISEAEKLAVRVISGNRMADQIDVIANRTVNKILSDEAVVEKAGKFVRLSVSDEKVHETVGYALWEAIKIAVIPSLLRPKPRPVQEILDEGNINEREIISERKQVNSFHGSI